MRIDLSEDLATTLQSRAEAQGISLQVWIEKLAAKPPSKPRYTLAQLMGECDLTVPFTEENRAWLDDLPIGRENP